MKTPYDVIIAPVRTEKSFMNVSEDKYTFIVARDANKTEIKIALEAIFGVKVEKVNTQIYNGKLKRQGRTQGFTPTTKRAIVKLTADSKKIDFFEGMA